MSDEKECIICFEPGTQINPLLNKSFDFDRCECKNTYFHQDPCYTRYRAQANTCPTCRRGFRIPINIGIFPIQEEPGQHVREVSLAAKIMTQLFDFSFVGFMIFTLAYMIKGMTLDSDMSSGNFQSTLGFTCLAYVACSILTHTRWAVQKFFSFLPLERSRGWRQFTQRVYSSFSFKVLYTIYCLIGITCVITSFITFYSEDRAVVENHYLFVSLRIITIVNMITYGVLFGGLLVLCIMNACRFG